MAIKKVQAKSGKMYDADSPQGKTIVASATVGQDANFDSSTSSLGADAGMAETLQLIYGETQESSDSLDNIEEALVDDGRETTDERNKRLEKSDKKPNKFMKALGAGKEGLLAGASKVKGSLSGKFGLLLLGGALVLLNKYSDELAGPDGILTKFLKYLKTKLIPDIKLLYEDLQVWWDKGWKKVNAFFTYVGKVFKAIGDYVDKFDTDGVPGLSAKEKDALLTDLKTKASSFISSMLIGMLSSVGTAIFTGALLVSGITLAKSALIKSGLFAATGAIPTATKGVGAAAALRAAKVGAGGYIAIGLMVAGSIAAMYDAAGRAATAALDEEGVTGKPAEWTTWAASFISGGDQGTWANAFGNLKEKGMMGAGVGVMLGIPFGPAGMLLGGMIGALAGGLFGLVTGKIGADKMKKALVGLDKFIDRTGDQLGAHFSGIVAAAQALLPGGTTPFNAYQKASGMNQELNIANRDSVLAQMEIVKAGGFHSNMSVEDRNIALSGGMPSQKGIDAEIARLQEDLDYYEHQIKMQPTYLAENKIEETKDDIKDIEKKIEIEKAIAADLTNLNTRGLTPEAAYRMYSTNLALENSLVRDKSELKQIMSLEEFTKAFESGDLQNSLIAEAEAKIVDLELIKKKGNVDLIEQQTDFTKLQMKLPLVDRDSYKLAQINRFELEKEMERERRAKDAKNNKFTTFNSPRIETTNTGVNYSNYTSQMSARSDFWANYDPLAAAVK